MGSPGPAWNTLFTNVSAQGPTEPLSADGLYYGYLSKADLDDESKTYDLFFELVPKAWADAAYMTLSIDVRVPAPLSPATVYHIIGADADTVMKLLGVTDTDFVAEGSWYLLELTKGTQGAVTGDLYDPDIDMTGQEPPRR